MPSTCWISSLIPAGFIAESETRIDDEIALTMRAEASNAPCPICAAPSRRIHSRYIRHVSDLPASGRLVRLHIVTQRFCCEAPRGPRQIFVERFDETVLRVRSRRTARLEGLVHHLGLALGGRPAAAFAKRLMLPVSNDTLLRVVRRRARQSTGPLSVIGIDDWAFRRNHLYGTIVCDLERRRVVALLPDREIATIEAWLAAHPEIEIVSRDRGGGYGEAAAQALPHAIHVADRCISSRTRARRFLTQIHAFDQDRDWSNDD
jgi:transposase